MQEAYKFCSACGQQNNLNAQFCQRCGTRQVEAPPIVPEPEPEPQSFLEQKVSLRHPALWIVIGLLGALFGGVLIALFPKPKPVPITSLAPIYSPTPTPVPTPTPSPAEHMAEAKKDMKEPYCQYGCQVASQHLEAIPSDAKEYKEAVKLLGVLKQRIAQGEVAQKRQEEQQAADARQAGADNVERGMLAKGYDVTVTVSGPRNTTIKITYVLMNRPMVYQLEQSGLLNQLRGQGFRKVIFADGYGTWWSYNL